MTESNPSISGAEAAALAETDWAYAYGQPTARARYRCSPEDFRVDEVLGFEPSGAGEHYLLQVQKRGANTDWVAKQLARHAGVKPMAVSYAGQKDRHAVTTQWFSVNVPVLTEVPWDTLEDEEFQILRAERHHRKLKRGALQGNRFTLVLRDVDGDHSDIESRLEKIAQSGVPNYFGPQRFGRNGSNLARAASILFTGRRERNRNQRSMALSAARSLLFNRVLSYRIASANWQQILQGEVVNLDGGSALFLADSDDTTLQQRADEMQIHPTGPLWGERGMQPQGAAAACEVEALAELQPWCLGLENQRLEMDRRALRVAVSDLSWRWTDPGTMELSFYLPAGAFATVVLREIALLDD